MNKQQGFTLIEVAIAALLIMLGVSGYVTLQSEYVVANENVNLKSIALRLAQQKLEDLYYFQQLDTLHGIQSYQEIATNVGGEISSGLRDVIVSSELNLQPYETKWQVEDVYFVDSNFDGLADNWVKVGDPFYPTEEPRFAGLKKITVSVFWEDTDGKSKQLYLVGNIAPIVLSQSYQIKQRSVSVFAVP